jgi:hypothetical protein
LRIILTRLAGVFAAAAIAVLLVAPSAPATGIIVGSPLTAKFSAFPIGGTTPLTVANTVLPEEHATLTSPVNGTVVSWRITDAKGGPFKLRVLRPVTGGIYKGVGTSKPGVPAGLGLHAFPTNLAIRIGDLIGLDDTTPPDLVNNKPGDQIGRAVIPGATVSGWSPIIADGTTAGPYLSVGSTELGFNATVEPTPFSFGKVRHNKHRGTAILTVNAPDPGRLVLFGKGLKRIRRNVANAGRVKLPIKPKGSVRGKLDHTGKAKVGAKVTFTLPGVSADTKTRRLTLRKRL